MGLLSKQPMAPAETIDYQVEYTNPARVCDVSTFATKVEAFLGDDRLTLGNPIIDGCKITLPIVYTVSARSATTKAEMMVHADRLKDFHERDPDYFVTKHIDRFTIKQSNEI